MTTIGDVLALVALVGAIVAYFVGRALLRGLRRVVRSAERQLGRRIVDAVFLWLGFSWLGGRRRRTPRARPAPGPAPGQAPVLEGDSLYRTCLLSLWHADPAACRWCNLALPARATRFCRPQCARTARENHEFGGPGGAREAALARDGYRCRWAGCGAEATHEHALEVHHIHACHGRHATPGCWHHLDGLVTLCHAHHAEVTAQQWAAGEFDTDPPPPRRIGA